MSENVSTPMGGVLKEKLKKVAHFKFLKVDGTVREAYGTTNPELIPQYKKEDVANLVEKARDLDVALRTDTAIISEIDSLTNAVAPFLPKEKKEKAPNDAVVNYYDLEAMGWRSTVADRIIEIL